MTKVETLARRPRRARSASPVTPDPIEIAMEAVGKSKVPDGAALDVLRGHARLIGWQVANHRASLALKVLTGLAGIAVAATIIGAVWRASQAQGLVVDPFSVPPAMAERGLDGPAVAALFLDELSQLQAQTDSGRAPSSFRNNWGDDLSVEIAQTGVSIDDAYRMLVGWVGKETRMTGGVSQGADRVSIVVRTGSRPIEAATGEATELQPLLRLAAERIYEQTQPYRYAILLGQRIRTLPPGLEHDALLERRNAILRTLTSNADPVERAWAYNGLATDEARPIPHTIPLLEAGLAIDPDHPFLLGNMAAFTLALGHDEASLGWIKKGRDSMARRPRHLNPDVIPANLARYSAQIAGQQGDFATMAMLYADAAVAKNANFSAATAPVNQAAALVMAHDLGGARGVLANLRYADDVAVAERIGISAVSSPFSILLAERGDWPAAVASLQAADRIYERLLTVREQPRRRTYLWPLLAHARARAGDLVGAQALITATPADCYLCVRQRARIAEIAGDRVAADHWFAEAVRQAPSLPFAYAERGEALLARGDETGAIALFSEAAERGPRWADPLKFWGDALAAQGDPQGAIRKYRAAAERAPRWGGLHLAWGRGLEADGRRNEALAKYRTAAGMDLSAADRAEVGRRLGAGRTP